MKYFSIKQHIRLIITLTIATTSLSCYSQDSKQEVLKVVNQFFHNMETKDSLAFNNLFIDNAQAYYVRQQGDSTLVRNSILKASSSKNNLKERLQEDETVVHVSKNVAAVWAPYYFWVNDEHSHCGYEVFTLIKTAKKWKITSVTYSVIKDDCKK